MHGWLIIHLHACPRSSPPPPMMADPMDHGCPRTARVLRHICRGRAVLPPRKPACPAVHATGTGSVATGTGTALTLPLKHLSPGLLACLEEMDPLDRVRVTCAMRQCHSIVLYSVVGRAVVHNYGSQCTMLPSSHRPMYLPLPFIAGDAVAPWRYCLCRVVHYQSTLFTTPTTGVLLPKSLSSKLQLSLHSAVTNKLSLCAI